MTELGKLPESWVVRRFDSAFSIQQGKQVSKRTRSGDNVRPFLRTKNVFWGALDLDDLDEMHFAPAEVTRLALQPDDLLICEGGEIGRTGIWQGELSDCYYQNHLHRARAIDPNAIDAQFALYWLWYAFRVGRVYFGRANVTTIPNLSKSRLGELPLPVPTSITEQRAIARCLRLVKDAAERRNQIVGLLSELRGALLNQVFSHGLRGEPVIDRGEMGFMPESWAIAPLNDYLVDAQYGLSDKGSETGQYALLRMTNQRDGRVSADDLQFVDLSSSEFERFRVEKYDILFNRTNSHDLVGRTALFDLDGDFVFASYLIRLKLKNEELRSTFLNHYLGWRETQSRLRSIAQRAVSQSNISASRLQAFPIPIPKPDEQDEIVALLDSVDASIELHRRTIEVLTSLFGTVLHQLMTAQVRVRATTAGTEKAA